MASDSFFEFDTDRLEASGNDVDRQNRNLDDWRNDLGPDPQPYNTLAAISHRQPFTNRPDSPKIDPRLLHGDAVLGCSHSHNLNDDLFNAYIAYPQDSTTGDHLVFDPSPGWEHNQEQQNKRPEEISVGDSAIDLSGDKSTRASFKNGSGAGNINESIKSVVHQVKAPELDRKEELRLKGATKQTTIIINQDEVPCTELGCNQTLKRRSLHKHIERVHKQKRSCHCTVCEKPFYSAKDLKVHQSSHEESREIVYLCPVTKCHRHEKGFTRSDNAYRHVKDKHKELLQRDAEGKVVKGCVTFETVRYRRTSGYTA